MPQNDYTLYICAPPENQRHSRVLLQQVVRRFLKNAAADYTLAETAQGKPYFPALPHVQTSVTHSGDYWLCAVGRHSVGLDLQAHQKVRAQVLSSRFFHPREDRFLRQENYCRFFDLWTAKESFVKYTGRGIADGLDTFSVVGEDGTFPACEGAQLRLLAFLPEYSLCICAREIGAVTVTQF